MKKQNLIIISITSLVVLVFITCVGYNAAQVKGSMHRIVILLNQINQSTKVKDYTQVQESFLEMKTIHEELQKMKPIIGSKEKWDSIHQTSIDLASKGIEASDTKNDEVIKDTIMLLVENKKAGHSIYIKKSK